MLTRGNTSFSMFYGIKKENGMEKKMFSKFYQRFRRSKPFRARLL